MEQKDISSISDGLKSDTNFVCTKDTQQWKMYILCVMANCFF